MQEQILTSIEAANYLAMEPSTLASWRVSGRGPTFIKLGKRAVRYRLTDLEIFIQENRHDHTASYAKGGVS